MQRGDLGRDLCTFAVVGCYLGHVSLDKFGSRPRNAMTICGFTPCLMRDWRVSSITSRSRSNATEKLGRTGPPSEACGGFEIN